MNTAGLDIREQVSLRDLTTFRTGGPARFVATCRVPGDVPAAVAFAARQGLPFCVLGGGSNVLAADGGYGGVVLHMALRGLEVLRENPQAAEIGVAAGEDWDGFVAHCAARGWWGVENLSGIPGTTGAVPVQNVGAYGQEVADTIVRVEAWDVQDRIWVALSAGECAFGYRRSIFNAIYAGRYVVSRVVFRLSRQGRANTSHAAVAHLLDRRETGGWSRLRQGLGRRWPGCRPLLDRLRKPPTPAQMRACILALRADGRLPDVRAMGNAGSFFKNAVLDEPAFACLLSRLSGAVGADAARRLEARVRGYAAASGVKIPAGELVKLCGLQDAREGGAALHSANPVVLVNATGAARAADVVRLAARLIRTVWERTGVRLEPEPCLIGFSAEDLAVLDPRTSGGSALETEHSAGPGGEHA